MQIEKNKFKIFFEQEIIKINPQLVPLTFYLRKRDIKFLTTEKPLLKPEI